MVRTISDARTCLPGLDSSFIIGAGFSPARPARDSATFGHLCAATHRGIALMGVSTGLPGLTTIRLSPPMPEV